MNSAELQQVILDYAAARRRVNELNHRKVSQGEAAPAFDALFQAEQSVLSAAKALNSSGGTVDDSHRISIRTTTDAAGKPASEWTLDGYPIRLGDALLVYSRNGYVPAVVEVGDNGALCTRLVGKKEQPWAKPDALLPGRGALWPTASTATATKALAAVERLEREQQPTRLMRRRHQPRR